MTGNTLHKLIIDSISSHIAVLDENGVIIETNRAWQDFAKVNDLKGPPHCTGLNYLSFCEQAAGECAEDTNEIAVGIRKVINGEQEEYFTQYSCHSPKEKRWFGLRAVRIRQDSKAKAIITHENITPIMEAHEKLEESNIALKVLLRQVDKEKQTIGEAVLSNVKELILPAVVKLQSLKLNEQQRILVNNIEKNLHDIVSPFLSQLSSVNKFLTPQEYRVASLVREGKTSKEIADFLGITDSAVDFHRKQMRRKFGLTATGKNLRSYLLSLG